MNQLELFAQKTCRTCKALFEPTPRQVSKADYICRVCQRTYTNEYRRRRRVIPLLDTKDWAPIPGLPNYEASINGQIRRVKPAKGCRVGTILKPKVLNRGHLFVGLSHNNVDSWHTVHSLVARAFLGPRPPGMQINHKDGNKRNPAASNLEYVTPRENTRHAIDVLGCMRGENNHGARFTDQDIIAIHEAKARGEPVRTLADRYHTSSGHICNILKGKVWKHLHPSRLNSNWTMESRDRQHYANASSQP